SITIRRSHLTIGSIGAAAAGVTADIMQPQVRSQVPAFRFLRLASVVIGWEGAAANPISKNDIPHGAIAKRRLPSPLALSGIQLPIKYTPPTKYTSQRAQGTSGHTGDGIRRFRDRPDFRAVQKSNNRSYGIGSHPGNLAPTHRAKNGCYDREFVGSGAADASQIGAGRNSNRPQ